MSVDSLLQDVPGVLPGTVGVTGTRSTWYLVQYLLLRAQGTPGVPRTRYLVLVDVTVLGSTSGRHGMARSNPTRLLRPVPCLPNPTADVLCKNEYRGSQVAWYIIFLDQLE